MRRHLTTVAIVRLAVLAFLAVPQPAVAAEPVGGRLASCWIASRQTQEA